MLEPLIVPDARHLDLVKQRRRCGKGERSSCLSPWSSYGSLARSVLQLPIIRGGHQKITGSWPEHYGQQ